jgi:hypothetical protein
VKHSLTCVDFRRFDKNTLCGFATVRIEQIRLVIHDVALHRKGDARWAALPARPFVKDGQQVTDADGKAQYVTTLEFTDRATREALSHAVWISVLAAHPELEGELVP